MPKTKLKLTWQKGTQGRAGRWRKMINGQMFYFDGGTGKSDRKAYQAAVEECEKLKAGIQATTEKPNADEYRQAIDEWEAVKEWCQQNGEEENYVDLAQKKIKELRRRLSGPRPRKLGSGDRFKDYFDASKVFRTFPEKGSNFLLDAAFIPDWMPGSQEELLWKDRIESHRRQKSPTEKTLDSHIQRFISYHRGRIGQITVGRWDNIRSYVDAFGDHVGGSKPVEAISEEVLREYYEHIQSLISKNEVSEYGGRDLAATADQFVRWLWREGAIDAIPRNLGTAGITAAPGEVIVYGVKEIKLLWDAATERMRLFMLLALNCGMTQQDISDLKPTEVDWKSGEIIRKRSKTRKKKSTPTITYRLWPETLRLLKKHRSKDKDHVLLNKNGNPFKSSSVNAEGKFSKIDTIGKDFLKLVKDCEIEGKSFINLKKTSRSILEDNKTYQPIAERFVGRAPRTVSDRHYAKSPTNWLAEATDWLRKKLKIDKLGQHPNKTSRAENKNR